MATSQPLKGTVELNAMRAVLTNSRDRDLFELGVGIPFRGDDLLKLKDATSLKFDDDLVINEQKTKKRRVTLRLARWGAPNVVFWGLLTRSTSRQLDGLARCVRLDSRL